ncbi:MAG TPA: DJ-1/PfpI family protein [Mucilaginibacter sp.]|nr:DJ-1/PfpI family protein [Mucilaginibacter sp.]
MKAHCLFLTVLLFIMCMVPSVQAQEKMAWYCPPCSSDCDRTAYAAPGKCPLCGMTLVQEEVAAHQQKLDVKRMKVLFYLQDGVEVLDFAGPLEVFSYAGFDVAIVSKTKDPIKSQGILKIIPDYSIADAPTADILAFFGGNAGNAANDPSVIRWLKNAPAPAFYFSVCTGAFILGKAGFLDHLTVTTFHESIESLRQAVPQAKVLENVRFVDNGKVMTTAGISAGIDGALHLVEKIRGRDAAIQIAKYMEYDKWVPAQGLILTDQPTNP